MIKTITSIEDVQKILPHRYENILIDNYKEPSGDLEYEGKTETTITANDTLGRHLFLKNKSPFKQVLCSSFFMEILALGAIALTDISPEGKLVYFASISNYKKVSDLDAGQTGIGLIKSLSSKQGFLKHHGKLISTDNTIIAEGNILAYVSDIDSTSDSNSSEDKSKNIQDIPQGNMALDIPKPASFKDPSMYIIDQLIHFDTDKDELTTKYTYPEDHPLIKGHFPGNPVMMGVMQLMGIEDALYALSYHLNQQGKCGRFRVSADAEIISDKGVLIATAKQIDALIWMGDSVYNNQAEIESLKKLVFRDVVRPGDTIYFKLTNVTTS